jgi:hypothetical protein
METELVVENLFGCELVDILGSEGNWCDFTDTVPG